MRSTLATNVMANPLVKILCIKNKNILLFVINLVCVMCWLCFIAGHRKVQRIGTVMVILEKQ